MTPEQGGDAARRLRVLNLQRTMSRARAEAIVYGGAEMTGAEQYAVSADQRPAPGTDGRAALRSLTGSRTGGAVALAHLDRLDELARSSLDLELLEAYGRAIGMPIAGVGHEPGRP